MEAQGGGGNGHIITASKGRGGGERRQNNQMTLSCETADGPIIFRFCIS